MRFEQGPIRKVVRVSSNTHAVAKQGELMYKRTKETNISLQHLFFNRDQPGPLVKPFLLNASRMQQL
jgi:hypothetical protein